MSRQAIFCDRKSPLKKNDRLQHDRAQSWRENPKEQDVWAARVICDDVQGTSKEKRASNAQQCPCPVIFAVKCKKICEWAQFLAPSPRKRAKLLPPSSTGRKNEVDSMDEVLSSQNNKATMSALPHKSRRGMINALAEKRKALHPLPFPQRDNVQKMQLNIHAPTRPGSLISPK